MIDPTEFEQSDEHEDEGYIDLDLFEDTTLDTLGDEFDEFDGFEDIHIGHPDVWTDLNQINLDDIPF